VGPEEQGLNASVVDLLGGCVRKLPVIASCHGHYRSIEEMADETAGWMEDGYQGLKTGFGKLRGNARLGYDTTAMSPMSAMRSARPDRMLMIDGIAIKWDVTDAVRRQSDGGTTSPGSSPSAPGTEGYANLRAKTTPASPMANASGRSSNSSGCSPPAQST
jgi:hypothetical protein